MAIIGLDATYLSIYGKGVSRYQFNLIKSLSKFDKKNYYYIFINKKNILPDLPQQNNLRYIRISVPNRIVWDQLQFPLIINKYKLDIYHTVSDTLPIFSKTKIVLCIFEIPDYRKELLCYGGYSSLYDKISHGYNKALFPYSLRRANIIIASSNSTKYDLIAKYDLREEKIKVVYPAADERFFTAMSKESLLAIRNKYNAEAGYILNISSSDHRDNIVTVIRAYEKALPKLSIPKKLIILGDINHKNMGLDKLIQEYNIENNVIFTGRLADKELVALYQAADLYIDPSLYEGFGFQVIEAMACGVAVITSNVTSLPEIVGDAGILVSPTDIDELASSIIKILTDQKLSSLMRQKSLERARLFSWDITAKQTLDIYNELLF